MTMEKVPVSDARKPDGPENKTRESLIRIPGGKVFLFWLMMITAAGSLPLPAAAEMLETDYPGLTAGILRFATLAPMEKEVVLKSEGVQIRRSDLMDTLNRQKPKIRAQLEKNLLYVVEAEATRRIILNEAQKAGIIVGKGNDEGAIQALFQRKVEGVKVSEGEIESFYAANKEMVGNVPLEQIQDGIREYLLKEKTQEAISGYIEKLAASVGLQLNKDWAKEQIRLALDNPVEHARRSGKPTMVEFGATGCVPCDMMQPILDKLRKNYSKKLNVVFVHVGEEQIMASRYGIRSIPVQVFYDAKGKEVFRHVGFYPEKEVLKQLERAGLLP